MVSSRRIKLSDRMHMVPLKRDWAVSFQALLHRARTLGGLDESAHEDAVKTMSRRGWRRDEPGYLEPPDQPSLLTKAVEALHSTGFALTDLAALNHLNEPTLRMIVGAGTSVEWRGRRSPAPVRHCGLETFPVKNESAWASRGFRGGPCWSAFETPSTRRRLGRRDALDGAGPPRLVLVREPDLLQSVGW
jgi:hypothetical protein